VQARACVSVHPAGRLNELGRNARVVGRSGDLWLVVPQMILQPLVENAIRHGIASSREEGWIEMAANASNGMLNMRVLIVDNEPLARAALAKILTANPDVESFDSANDAIEAQERLSRDSYDVVLLDISIPSGLELLGRLKQNEGPLPSVVIVTAHAQYAVAAFERHAVDYVLKPFSAERVNQSLDFAYRKRATERTAKLIELMPYLRMLTQQNSSKIGIKSNGRIHFIDPHDVVVVQAEGNYVLLERETGSDLLRESISTIAEKLKGYGFVRIRRSLLVNASFVQEIRPCPTGEYQLRVRDGREYTVTRTYKKNLRGLAAFWIGTGTFLTD
jgi:two-component system LytT family response regulator